jgi:lipid-A-disaccharide synthase-like uncharacterized protein
MDTTAAWVALWFNERFLGIEWHPWKVVGWIGNVLFFSRFLVQWYATERQKRVVVPQAFWWLSLSGSLVLLSYAITRRDSVFIVGQSFSWIPYLRNLWIHRRNKTEQVECAGCGAKSPGTYRYCPACARPLVPGAETATD